MTARRCAPYLFGLLTLISATAAGPQAESQTVPADTAATRPRSPEQRTSRGTPAVPARPTSPILARSLGWTGGVLAVGAVALIASRKFVGSGGQAQESSAERARVSCRLQLGPRQAVHVVRIGQRTLVIGTGPQGSPVTLAQWSESEDETRAAGGRWSEGIVRIEECPDLADSPVPSTNSQGAAA